jgi:hypothetical protein
MAHLLGRKRHVGQTGALQSSILCGGSAHNQGLRLRIMQTQAIGEWSIQGPFVILDVGNNRHSQVLASLQGRATDAQEVLEVTHHQAGTCISVVNSNALCLEGADREMEPLSDFCLEAIRGRDQCGDTENGSDDRSQLLHEVDRLKRELHHTHANLVMVRQSREMPFRSRN